LAGLAEPLGANTLLHGSLNGSGEALTASLPGIHHLPRFAQAVKLSVDAENVHLFDKSTEQRIDQG